jgi:hypothetical protein
MVRKRLPELAYVPMSLRVCGKCGAEAEYKNGKLWAQSLAPRCLRTFVA